MRDYKKEPLKFGEDIPYEDLYEIYINQNTSMKETWEFFGISKDVLRRNLKLYSLHKSIDQAKELRKQTNLQKYGVENLFMDKERTKKGVQEKYGVDNPAHLDSVLEKRKETCKKRYGGSCPFNSKSIRKKIERVNKKRYGGNSPQCSAEVREKSKKTCLEKYNVENISQLEETKQKVKNSFLEHYGVENISQSEEIKQKKVNTFNENHNTPEKLQAIILKREKTCIEKYGKDGLVAHIHNIKMLKGSYTTSKEEEICYNKLLEKFSIVERQKEYINTPKFRADFYIPSLDLFIEYNGHGSHGKHPFDPNNEQDLKLLQKWKQKSEEINFKGKKKKQYKMFIYCWTKKDPAKRLAATSQNMNLLEFFSMEEFMDWYNKI